MPARVSRTTVLVIATTVAALGLRLFRIAHQSLWVDEVLTYESALGTWTRVLTQVEVNTYIPPLYSLMVKLALPLGPDEAMIRLPAALAGVLSVPLFFVMVRHWVGEKTALAATFLFALSPFHLWYSQEGRPYSLVLFFGLLALWAFQQVRRHPGHNGWRVAFIGAMAAALYAHTIAVALLVLLAVLAVVEEPRGTWKRSVPIALTVLVLVLAAVYRLVLSPQPFATAGGGETFSLTHLGYTVWTFFTGFSLGPSTSELHDPRPVSVALRHAHVIAPVLIGILGLMARGVMHLWKHNRAGLKPVALWLVVPVITVAAAAVATRHMFHVRYVVLAFPAALVLFVAGIESLPGRYLRGATWILTLAVTAASLTNYFADPAYQREDIRAAASQLGDLAAPGDVVIVSAPYNVRPLRFYLGRDDLRLRRYPDAGRAAVPPLIEGSIPSHLREERVTHAIRELGEREGRYWLFLSRTFHGDRHNHLVQASERSFGRTAEVAVPGVRVLRYENRFRPDVAHSVGEAQ
jgi:mannosyltransferase